MKKTNDDYRVGLINISITFFVSWVSLSYCLMFKPIDQITILIVGGVVFSIMFGWDYIQSSWKNEGVRRKLIKFFISDILISLVSGLASPLFLLMKIPLAIYYGLICSSIDKIYARRISDESNQK